MAALRESIDKVYCPTTDEAIHFRGLLLASVLLILIWLHCGRKRRERNEDLDDDDSINGYVLDELEPTRPTKMGLRRQALIRLGLRKDKFHGQRSTPAGTLSDLEPIIPKYKNKHEAPNK